MNLSQLNINFFKEYFLNKAGIVIGEDKAYLLENRLAPVVKKLGFKSYDELILNIKLNKPNVVSECIDAISTNETFFFRDIKPFRIFEQFILPKIIASNTSDTIRIWSAACSSGQEAYSIAISLLENKAKLKGKKFEIIGTDISPSILKRAQEGVYNSFEIQRGLPVSLMIKYFEKASETDWKIKNEVKSFVKFKELNLLSDVSSLGDFDCVFCRYVLIYFDDKNKKLIAEKIIKRLKPCGALIMGVPETNNLSPTALEPHSDLRSIFFRK